VVTDRQSARQLRAPFRQAEIALEGCVVVGF